MRLDDLRKLSFVVVFVIATSAAIAGNLIPYAMIGEVNRKKSDHEAIKYVGFSPDYVPRIVREYRLFYPEGRYIRRLYGAIALLVLAFIGEAITVLSFSVL